MDYRTGVPIVATPTWRYPDLTYNRPSQALAAALDFFRVM